MEDRKEALKRLREPFPEDKIDKLVKPTIKAEEWNKLKRFHCEECGGYHPKEHTIHLDYVGHAALTARLLEVDEEWNWEPLAYGADGLPLIDKDGGMWIKLTICGITRIGYGDAQGKTGGNATKERIGDALRNAAMRFGAALDLWKKGEKGLFLSEEENTSKPPIKEKSRTSPIKTNPSAASSGNDKKSLFRPEELKKIEKFIEDTGISDEEKASFRIWCKENHITRQLLDEFQFCFDSWVKYEEDKK